MRLPTLDDRLAVRERPRTHPVMFQTWRDLLFLHWEIDPKIIQARLPSGLTVDLHDGKTYLGLVPFFMKKVRPKFLPCIPWLSNFMELNVRAYVHDEQGRPGVWFFSLDCNQPIAVEFARKFFHLPYQHARMKSQGPLYQCQRSGKSETATYNYQATQNEEIATPGSLEFFLLERYLLFSENRQGQLKCGQVHHLPYTFTAAPTLAADPTPILWEGFQIEGHPASTLVSSGVDVEIFALRNAASGTEKER
ncbi:DUF2071 domain-containing protein [Verrucomicrobiaceae bacterium 227]